MKVLAVITVEFGDTSENRAETRAKELAGWMGENLAAAYGSDSDLKVLDVTVYPEKAK